MKQRKAISKIYEILTELIMYTSQQSLYCRLCELFVVLFLVAVNFDESLGHVAAIRQEVAHCRNPNIKNIDDDRL